MQEYEECLNTPKKLKICKRGYCSAKQKFDVYPSAYANIYASRVCRGEIEDFEGKKIAEREGPLESGLQRWLDEKWVNVCEGKPYPPCGRQSQKEKYPYCRPSVRINSKTPKTVQELSQDEIAKMCAFKRSTKQGVEGKPTRVLLTKQPDFNRFTIKELRDMSKELGGQGYSNLTKKELIQFLQEIF